MTPPSQDETSPRALPQLPLRRGTLRDDTWRLAALLLGSVVVVIVGGLWLVVRFDLPEVAVTITTLLAIVLPIVVVLGRAEGSVTMGDDGFVIRDGRLSRFVAFDEVTDIRPWWGHPRGSKQAYFMARVELVHGPPLDLIVAGVPSTSEG